MDGGTSQGRSGPAVVRLQAGIHPGTGPEIDRRVGGSAGVSCGLESGIGAASSGGSTAGPLLVAGHAVRARQSPGFCPAERQEAPRRPVRPLPCHGRNERRPSIRPGDRRLPDTRTVRLLRHERSPAPGLEELQSALPGLHEAVLHRPLQPAGNHFFAYSIKDKVVEWLDPKPITYRDPDPQSIDFQGYLQD